MTTELNFPILRVEIESMKHTLMHAFEDRHQDLLAAANAGIDAAIAELPHRIALQAKELSESIILQAMEAALKEYWEQGAGREMIDEMLAKRFKRL